MQKAIRTPQRKVKKKDKGECRLHWGYGFLYKK